MAFVFLLPYILRHFCGLTFKVGKILPSVGDGHAVTIYLFTLWFGFFIIFFKHLKHLK